MSTVGLISNPKSHTVSRQGSVLQHVARQIPGLRFLQLDDFSALPGEISAFARRGVNTLFVEGGDGTLRAVMSAALSSRSGFAAPPGFAILPGGSTNLAYKVLGLKDIHPEAVARRIALLENKTPVRRAARHALAVRSSAMSEPLIGFLLSTGSLARAMEYGQREIHGPGPRGSLAVAAIFTRLIARPFSASGHDGEPVLRESGLGAEAGEERFQGAHTFSLMTTLPHLSLGLKPFWGTRGRPIAFTHARWPVRGLRLAALKLVLGLTGETLSRHGLGSLGADRIRLHTDSDVMMDGEMLARPADGLFDVSVTPSIEFIR